MYEDRASHETSIGRLALHLPPGTSLHERAAWGRRAASALDAAELKPRGLPPHAILVVQQLADPRPGALLARDAAPWQAGAAWGRLAKEAIEACWRHAARPLRGPAGNAPAVWFADRAEWLACLSVDLYYGVAGQRWWWRTWLGLGRLRGASATGTAALVPLWVEEARSLPSALALLQAEMPGVGAELVSGLSSGARQSVRAALAAAYGLPSAPPREPEPAAQEPEGWAHEPEPRAANSRASTQGRSGGRPAPDPAARFLAFALALHHGPAAVRAAGGWLEGEERDVAEASRAAKASDLAGGLAAGARGFGPAHATAEPNGNADMRGRITQATRTGSSAARAAQDTTAPADDLARVSSIQGARVRAHIRTGSQAPAPNRVRPPVPRAAARAGEALRTTPPLADGPAREADADWTAAFAETGVRTALGGAFYLVNVLIDAGLLAGDAGPSPWERVAALAWALLSQRRGGGRAHAGDPLWQALAGLDGEDDTCAGGTHARTRRKRAARRRLWLARHFEPLVRRTACSLGAKRAGARGVAALLARPAVLYVTRTHVDVVFRLEQIDLAVRQAGLDRNPGWVPDLGRVIAFHFE